MKNDRLQKIICVLIVFCILIPTTPLVYAVDLIDLIPDFSKDAVETLKLDDDCQILRYVDSEVLAKGNHIGRLKGQEKLDTYVFQNRDGTRTVYYMNGPVKFRDDNGNVREKDLTLVEKTGGHGVASSDMDLLLPGAVGEGVDVTHAGLTITIYPEDISFAAKAGIVDGESYRYRDCFGSGIDLVYTPTLLGLKEDIVIERYFGKRQFSFLIETDDLRLFQKDGKYYFAGGQNSDDKLWLGDLLIYDAMGKPGTGTMNITTLEEGQMYRVTLAADEEFLLDSNTVYPVTIDPTVQVSISDANYAGAIQDATVYSNQPNLNTGNWTFNHAGKYDDSYGVGRVVYRLTGLMADEGYAAASAAQVSSVKFYVRDASGNPTSAWMYLYALTSNSTWTETGVTFGNYGSYDTSVLYGSAAIGGNNWAEFDITNLARDWKYGYRNPSCGMVLVNANETSTSYVRGVISSEYGASSSWPYVVATYESVLSMNTTNTEINVGGTTTISLATGVASTWTSSNTAVATVSNGVVTGVRAGTATITATNANGATASCTVTVKLPTNAYHITQAGTSLLMGTAEISQRNGVRASIQNYNAGQIGIYSQLWCLEYAGNGYYTIRPSFNPDKYLVVFGDTLIAVCESNTTAKQWKVFHDGNGYVLQNRRFGYYLYLDSGAVAGSYVEFESDYYTRWNLSTGTATKRLLLFESETGERLGVDGTAVLGCLKSMNVVCAPFNTHTGSITMSSCSLATLNASTNQVTGGNVCATESVTVTDSCGTSLSFTLRTVLPLSGSELPYQPELWNPTRNDPMESSEREIALKAIKIGCNCYMYALNIQVTPGTNEVSLIPSSPGSFAGGSVIDGNYLTGGLATLDNIEEKVGWDATALNWTIEEVEREERCQPGTYKIMVACTTDNRGYHWFRQNADGSWSQKMGDNKVTNKKGYDGSGTIIWDPQIVVNEDSNYEKEVRYFAVTSSTAYMYDLPSE